MKLARVFWLLVVAVLSEPAQAATNLERVHLHGRDYVRLADWAKAYNFKLTWLKREESVQVNSRWSKLIFTVDSRRAELNGIGVWLSFPIAYQGGHACISPLDLDKVFHAVLFPPKNRDKERVMTICLDPGHGGRDPGNQDGRNQEKDYTLMLAQELQRQLKEAGFKVIMTRSSDKFVDLGTRSLVAKNLNADLFVSLHFNSARSSASGTEVYCLTPPGASSTNAGGEGATSVMYPGNRKDENNMLLAFHVQKQLTALLPAEDRGVRRARFAVLKYVDMPAILVEGGFMSDRTEARKIYSAAYRRQMAKAIFEGIQAYKRTVERE
ncbi:MAG: N-acetylmuramoyl-L-alanine amidase [Verrucomicrobiota bacterium]